MTKFEISEMKSDESNFVHNSVKQSERNGAMRDVPTHVAFSALNPRVNAMIARSAILVARSGSRILGFIVFEVEGDELVLNYVYTRAEYRRQGVAMALLQAVLDESPSDLFLVAGTPSARFADLMSRYGIVQQESA